MRRPAATGALVAGAAAVFLGACASTPNSAAQLRSRLDRMDAPSRFDMTYVAAGTDVLDCALPNRTFVLDVDLASGVVVVDGPAEGADALARRDGRRLLLHRSLLDADLDATWVAVDLDELDPAETDAVHRVLGADLATYLLAPDLPPAGETIASAALEIASTVELLADDRARTSFRIRLDAQRFAQETEHPGTTPTTAPEPAAPIIEVVIDGDAVTSVTVRPPDAEDADTTGWTVSFAPRTDPLQPTSAGSTVALNTLDLSTLRPRSIETCTLGGVPGGAAL